MTLQEDIASIFAIADRDKSGTLTVDEFKDVINDICIRYPQIELYMKNKKISKHVNLLYSDGKKEVNIEEFKAALAEVDSQMKNLPATAQVIDYLVMIVLSVFYTHLGHGRLCMQMKIDKLYVRPISFLCLFISRC